MPRNRDQSSEETKAYNRAYYAKNAEAIKAKIGLDRKRRQGDTRALIREAKDNPCADCGLRYPSYVMDFDHVRGEKKFNISQANTLGVGRARLLDEISKCEVVCSNCHRVRTHAKDPSLAEM